MPTKARYAVCGSVSVVRPSAVAHIVAAHLPHASLGQSIGAAAQQAAVADAAARPRDRAVLKAGCDSNHNIAELKP